MKKRILASLLSLCLIVGLLPAAALAAEGSGTGGETPVVCTMDEGCAAETHDEGCPLYAAPEEPAPCALTEGCTLEAGHEGECALPDGPTVEETLAGMIAALPNPADIDPLDEEQVEEVNGQISEIYAFAGENGLDVEDNEIISAVIAALYPAEPLDDPAPVDEAMSGNCGNPTYVDGDTTPTDKVKWELTQNNVGSGEPTYTLTFTGTGDVTWEWRTEDGKRPPYYSYASKITKVVVGEGITGGARAACAGCTNLTEVTLPSTFGDMGNDMFSGCTSLKKIDLPASLYNMGNNVFNGCTALETVNFAPDTGEIKVTGFKNCTSLTSISLPDKVTSVGSFENSGLTSITIAPSVNCVIAGSAFARCDSLESVIIGKNVTSIGKQAFYDDTALTTVSISAKEIGEQVFGLCTALANVTLNEGVTTIGNNAFATTKGQDKGNLKVLRLPSTITSIGTGLNRAYMLETLDMSAATNITFPSSDFSLGMNGIVYVSTGTIADALRNADSRDAVAIAVTNGGTFEENQRFTKNTFTAPVRDGKVFAGWYANKDFTGGAVTSPQADNQGSAIHYPIYYAKWIYKITFDANGGEGTMTAQEITEGDTTTALTTNSFTKTGYTFSGWNTKADGTGTSYENGTTSKPTTSTTLYAQWTPNTYTISFNGGTGASGSTANVTATYNQPATLTDNSFIKSGYNFAGWDTDTSADEVVYSDGAQVENLTETANGTVTLYAVWTTKAVLNPDVSVQTMTYNGAEQAFTLDGYTISYQQDGETVTPKDAGTYDVVISTDETNTTAAYKNTVYGGLVINPAPLTITPNNKTAYVGDALPTLGVDDYTVTGLVGDDTLNTKPTLAYDGTPDMNTADTYAIKASGAEAGDNYTITYVDGTLTVSTHSSGGSSGGGSSSGNSGNVTGSGDDVNVDVSGGSVTAAQMEKAVDRADRGETITIEATSRSSVSLPSSGLQDAADNDNDVTVELKNGEVTLSPEALSAVAEQAGTTVTLTVDPVDTDELNSRQQAAVGDAPVFDLTIKSGGKTITDFDGGLVTVAIPYELPDGQDPAGVVVWFMDDNGNITACETMYDLRTETVIFTTRHFSKYVIGYVEPMAFTDVPADAYYAAAVAWAVENGITSGTGDGTTFSPDISCTRAQMMTFLWRAAGSPAPKTTANPFTDVQADAYYYDAVLWAAENGITTGTGDTTFSPDATVTRAQTVTFMYRAAGSPAVIGSSFSDVAEDAYYADAVAWAVEEGITAGTGGNTFSPDAACTRAQIVTFLYRDAQ